MGEGVTQPWQVPSAQDARVLQVLEEGAAIVKRVHRDGASRGELNPSGGDPWCIPEVLG